jgi:hypothetical protein
LTIVEEGSIYGLSVFKSGLLYYENTYYSLFRDWEGNKRQLPQQGFSTAISPEKNDYFYFMKGKMYITNIVSNEIKETKVKDIDIIWSYDLPVEDGLSARMHCAYLAPKSAEPFRGEHIAHA